MTFWEVEKTIAFLAELVRLLFGQRLEKLGLHFISTSGHTVRNSAARNSARQHDKASYISTANEKIRNVDLCVADSQKNCDRRTCRAKF